MELGVNGLSLVLQRGFLLCFLVSSILIGVGGFEDEVLEEVSVQGPVFASEYVEGLFLPPVQVESVFLGGS